MKDKSLNVPATLDIAPRKITKHKSHLQSSAFRLNQIKITHSTGNDLFNGFDSSKKGDVTNRRMLQIGGHR